MRENGGDSDCVMVVMVVKEKNGDNDGDEGK